MEIKRKLELSIAKSRKFVIQQSRAGEQKLCEKCRVAMVSAEQAARFFGIKQRFLFQIIEENRVHFTETNSGLVDVCLTSLAAVLDD